MRRAWLALLVGSSIALAEPLSSPAHVKLRSAATPLLGDQIKALLPADMQPEPVEATTSAGVRPSYREEDRYSLELDDVHFTMIVYETYASIGTDFKAGVVADLKTQGENLRGAKLNKLPLAPPLIGYEVLPVVPKSSYDAGTLVYAVYVGNPDATVEVLAFYLAPEGLPYAKAWVALSRRISTSVVLGKHPVDGKAGEHRLGDIAVTTSDGWAASTQLGPESSPVIVQQLRKIVPLGKDGPACSLQWGGMSEPVPSATTTSGVAAKVLGENVTWTEWTESGREFGRVVLPKASRHSDMVVTCTAPNHDDLSVSRRMFETLHFFDRSQRAR
jgi:hypothetical protein